MRGNWQRRVERTEARRAAAKLQKEHRRNKRHSSSASGGDYKMTYRRLGEWLDDKGDDIGVSYNGDDIDIDADADADADAVEEGVDIPGSCITVDIWTDDRPQNRPEYIPPPSADDDDDGANCHDDFDDEEGRNSKGKSKGNQKEKYRGGHRKKKGKAHPNKNKPSEDNNETISRDRSGSVSNHALKDDKLCGREFFFGKEKCKGSQQIKQQQRQKGGRKGRSDSIGGDHVDHGCSFQHYHQLPKVKRNKQKETPQSPPMTLSQVMNQKFKPHHIHRTDDDNKPSASLPVQVREAVLKSTFNAAMEDESDTLDMIYHSRYTIDNSVDSDSDNGNGSDDNESASSSDVTQKSKALKTLEQLLKNEHLTTTSLVYLSIQGVLVYDRNREGLIFTDSQERFLLFGYAIDATLDEYVDNVNGNNEKDPIHIHEQLTHHLLDEILSYAGDKATATLPQVCLSWRDEVGTRSPQLWKMLLDRHGWPLSERGDVNYSESTSQNDGQAENKSLAERDQCRRDFVSHYTVARDIRAMANTCNYMIGDNGSVLKHNVGVESAMQIFKATKGAPMLEGIEGSGRYEGMPYCYVKIWSDTTDGNNTKNTRALAAYEDCTLRLFDVVGGSMGSGEAVKATMKCRQLVSVRPAPPSSSKKKDSCTLNSMDIDEDVVACFFYEACEEVIHRNGEVEATDSHTPWITVISREDVACAGNEGALEDDCIQSYDLRGAILDFLLGGVSDDSYEELQEGLHNYLSVHGGDTDDVYTKVTSTLVACGKGHFLFHAYVMVPGHAELGDGEGGYSGNAPLDSFGHRLFLFSSRKGSIVKSLHLESIRESTSLFASRPYTRPATSNSASALHTSILVSGPTHHLLLLSVEIERDGTIKLQQQSMIKREELAQWSGMKAVLSSEHVVFSTDPLWQGPLIHFQKINETSAENFHTVEISGGSTTKLHSMFLIRENYIAVIITNGQSHNNGEDEEEFDGHWLGEESENQNAVEVIVFHVPTRQEIYRQPFPSETISVDCIGDTLALNLSHIGFVITGGNARNVARKQSNDEDTQIASPSGKNPKSKKKRLASLAKGRKKDGFARGMSLSG